MWSIKRETSRKTIDINNIDAITSLAVYLKVLTKKLGKSTQNVSMVHQPKLICGGCGIDHITA